MRNALTIDVEDWFTSSLALFDAPRSAHGQRPAESVVTNTRRMLDLLDEYGHKATFFVLGTVAEHYPGLVQEIHQQGHEIATHGYSHRLVYQMTPSEFEADVTNALNLTEAITGSKIVGHRAPYFSLTRKSWRAFDILLGKGIRYDSSEPLAQKLAAFPFALGPGAPLSAFLDMLKGARLDASIGGQILTGVIVSGRQTPATAQQPERVGDVPCAAAEFAAQRGHKERDVQDVHLLGQDLLGKPTGEGGDRVERE